MVESFDIYVIINSQQWAVSFLIVNLNYNKTPARLNWNSQSLFLCLLCMLSLQSCLTPLQPPMNCSPRPLSLEFSKQEYWNGFSCPLPGALSHPGMEHWSPALQADSVSLSHWGSPSCLTLPFLESPLLPLILTLYRKCGRAGGQFLRAQGTHFALPKLPCSTSQISQSLVTSHFLVTVQQKLR